MKTNKEIFDGLLRRLNNIQYIKPSDIPDIELYMDQVTTFMENRLNSNKRHEDDKALTKTMINNYAKNRLLPAPEKKKYTKEHMFLLIFIYYFKNILSLSDIETIFNPLNAKYFGGIDSGSGINFEDIYKEVFTLEEKGIEKLKSDMIDYFDAAEQTFQDAPESDRAYLTIFSLICELASDVYLKKQMIEQLVDYISEDKPDIKKKVKK